jgi:hypothetical protein
MTKPFGHPSIGQWRNRRLTTFLGPRTADAGLNGTAWPVISQSNSMRTVASCCLTSGAVKDGSQKGGDAFGSVHDSPSGPIGEGTPKEA